MELKMENGQLIMKESVLKEKSYRFALSIVMVYKKVAGEQKEFVLSKQLLRSGTAVGALVEEANQAESKADFIHKLAIANKEANESQYWIRLLKDSSILGEEEARRLLEDCNELIRILTASIKTTKAKIGRK